MAPRARCWRLPRAAEAIPILTFAVCAAGKNPARRCSAPYVNDPMSYTRRARKPFQCKFRNTHGKCHETPSS
jgi:hypothetical protein